MAPIEVRTLAAPDEHVLAAELFGAVWYDDGTVPIESHLLTAVHRTGGYVAGALADGVLVGASLGLLARGHGDGELVLHSHVTGVRPGHEHLGIGRALKRHQRAWAADAGLAAITWTFDTLVRRNAWFNLAVLGARIVDYVDRYYGTASDALNRGDETDRAVVRWDVRVDAPNVTAVAPAIVDAHGTAHAIPVDATLVTMATPDDAVALRRDDPAAAQRWRRATRTAMHAALDAGFAVVGVDRAGTYTLERT